MREIDEGNCTCGGKVDRVEPTKEEDKRNCPRGCCLIVLECDKCNTRFCLELESPDME